MKKLIFFVSLLLSYFAGIAQPRIARQTGTANTLVDQYVHVDRSFRTPAYNDTAQANNQFPHLDSCGAIIFTYDVMAHWSRVCSPKRWVRIGTVTSIISSSSILVSGSGTASAPFQPSVIPSQQNNNAVVINPDGVFVQTQVQNGLIEGGILTWVSGYTYDVSPARYGIQNVIYNSLQDQITFANANPLLPRIDEAAVNTVPDVEIIQGIPSESPQEPSYNPLTQVPLAFVFIDSNSVAPDNIVEEYIYKNNAEWTTVSNTGRIVNNSTSLPFSPTLTIEATLAQQNDSLIFTDPSPPTNMTTYTVITMKLRSKAVWPTGSRITFQWWNGATLVGVPVGVAHGTFGFNSSNTTDYATITIPLTVFGVAAIATNITRLTARVDHQTGSGNTIGFRLDDIRLLGGDGVVIPSAGNFWAIGGNVIASTGRLGTQTAHNIDIITGNDIKARFNNASSDFELFFDLWMRGGTPGISMFLNTFTNSDYYFQRNGTTLLTHTAGDYATKFTGNNVYLWNKNDGHTWSDSLGTFLVRFSPTGESRFGSNASVTNSIMTLNSTTKALTLTRQTTTQMNAIGTPTGGMITYNTTVNSPYYYNGTVWTPFGTTALSSITPAVALNIINSGTFAQEWQWNTLANNTALKLSSTSIAAANNVQKVFEVSLSGANATAGQSTYGAYISNTHTGASGNNYGIFSNASGMTGNNYGIWSQGSIGIYGFSNVSFGKGVIGDANNTNGYGGQFFNNGNGYGLNATAINGIALEVVSTPEGVDNSVHNSVQVRRTAEVLAANGIGIAIQLQNATTTSILTSNSIISKWTDATNATRTSQFIITGVNSASTADILILNGNGSIKFNDYGVGSNTGTATFTLQVDASGNVIEGAVGAGTGDVLKVGTPANNQVGVWTGNGTIEGDAALTFTGGALIVGLAGTTLGQLVLSGNTAQTVTLRTLATAGNYTLTLPSTDGNAGEVLSTDGSGNLSFIAAGSVGTVTNVTWAGGIISIANPTTVPAFTIAGTSGGIPYFSSGTTWATSAVLAANAIVIGGGAGVAPSTTTTASGIVTWIGTPSSANLRSALTDETGTGALYFQSGDLGIPTAGTISTGITLGDVTMNVAGIDATGDIYYRSAGGLLIRLGIGTNGQILRTSAGGIPEWATISGSGTVTNFTFTNANGFIGTVATPTTTPSLTLGTNLIGVLRGNGTAMAAVTSSTVGQILRVTGADAFAFGQLDLANTNAVTGTLQPGSGGTGVGAPFNNGILLIGNGTGFTKAAPTGVANQIEVFLGPGTIAIGTVFKNNFQTLTDAANTIWNVSNGGMAIWTNSGTNRTLTIQNPVIGHTYWVRHIQGAGGNHTIQNYPGGTRWPNGGAAPTLTSTAGAIDVFTFTWDGATFWADYKLNY